MIAVAEGTSLAFHDAGTGTPVVFLHAFPLNHTMWAAQTGALAAHCRCIAPDVRGFGASSAAPPWTMDRFADDVAAVLDAAHVERAVIVGLSMGGYVSFAFWRRHRGRVRALVLADTRATADDEPSRERRRQVIELARAQGSEAVADRQVTGLLGRTTREKHPDLVTSVRRILASASVEGIIGASEAMIARPDSSATLATIEVPTLIVVGDEDAITPTRDARAMHTGIPGSRLEVLPGAGHLSNLERPAAFNTVLGEFLAQLASS